MLEFLYGGWNWPVIDDTSTEQHKGLMEGTFLSFEEQMEFSQAFQDLCNVVGDVRPSSGSRLESQQCRLGWTCVDAPGVPHA